jgi:hypothetical protein
MYYITGELLDILATDKQLLEECQEIYIYDLDTEMIEFLEKFKNLKWIQMFGPMPHNSPEKMHFPFTDLTKVKSPIINMYAMDMDKVPTFHPDSVVIIGNSVIKQISTDVKGITFQDCC